MVTYDNFSEDEVFYTLKIDWIFSANDHYI